jgi:hypothetical protein
VVGAIEAEQTKSSALITALDFILVAWFCIECNIHIAAEGQHPQCYFFGRDAEKWNTQAKWNVFDFTVSYLSLVLATVITEVMFKSRTLSLYLSTSTPFFLDSTLFLCVCVFSCILIYLLLFAHCHSLLSMCSCNTYVYILNRRRMEAIE